MISPEVCLLASFLGACFGYTYGLRKGRREIWSKPKAEPTEPAWLVLRRETLLRLHEEAVDRACSAISPKNADVAKKRADKILEELRELEEYDPLEERIKKLGEE